MNKKNQILPDNKFDEVDRIFCLEKLYSMKGEHLIERFKKSFKRYLQSIDYQIKRDIDFWLKYRPSRWLSFIPKRHEKTILRFIDKKNSKKFIFYTALIFCLI